MAENERLQRENEEPRKANEALKAASVFSRSNRAAHERNDRVIAQHRDRFGVEFICRLPCVRQFVGVLAQDRRLEHRCDVIEPRCCLCMRSIWSPGIEGLTSLGRCITRNSAQPEKKIG